MTKTNMDSMTAIRKHVEQDGDLVQGMIKAFAEAIMGAEVNAQCGASYGERSEERGQWGTQFKSSVIYR